jgi:hypothetical protein
MASQAVRMPSLNLAALRGEDDSEEVRHGLINLAIILTARIMSIG